MTHRQGLRANREQFALLVAVNAFVGGMVGLERTILPLLAEDEFGIASRTAAVSFIAAFGAAKALANLVAGRLAERTGRRRVLLAGWLVGLPVPFLLIWAPSWGWVIGANVLLGVNQGLAWSMTVNMKIDLVGPARRGLATGLNEAAGYLAVGGAAFASGLVAEAYGLRPEPFYLGIAFAAAGTALSVLFVRETAPLVRAEAGRAASLGPEAAAQRGGAASLGRQGPSLRRAFAEVTWRRRDLFGISQTGFVNNLNDGLAWGIFPLFFVGHGLGLERVAVLAAAYPLLWGSLQLVSGWASDRLGRRPLVVAGMLLQGAAIVAVAVVGGFEPWLAAVVALGIGTALVYPTLLAAVGDAVVPSERATSLGVYRFWRDSGAVAGALGAGLLADAFGFEVAIVAVGALTIASGLVAATTMRDRPVGRELARGDGQEPGAGSRR